MILFPILILTVAIAYLALMLYLYRGLQRFGAIDHYWGDGFSGKLSVIIPCFNDAEALKKLIPDLIEQNWPRDKFEVWVVDDHSQPEQAAELKKMARKWPENFELLQNTAAAGKKEALTQAWAAARYDIVVQTDADCRIAPGFLREISRPFADKNCQVVLGLVKMKAGKNGIWSQLAALDFLSLQLAGIATALQNRAFMGNGAALAYRKHLRGEELLHGNQWRSGDDVFLIQAAQKRAPGSVKVAPSAQVETTAPSGLKEFISQRVRWGSKTGAYSGVFPKVIALVVAAINLTWVILLISALFNIYWLPWFLTLGTGKLVVEYFLLWYFARETRQGFKFRELMLALLYPFYISITVVLILLAGKLFTWKGRKLRV